MTPPAAGATTRPRHSVAARHVALLGGTTDAGDCLTVLGYLLRPARLVRGPQVRAFEQLFAERVGTRYGYSFAAGRVGLYGVLQALGVGAGDEVLLGVPTHVVVANAVRYTGARPVYVDCDPETYTMDLADAERRVGPATKAIILQHTFGIPVDVDAALALARMHGLSVIEDCVHALGSTWRGRPVGSFGDAAFFSTEETKTISTTMGGMVVTDDPPLAARLAAFQRACAPPPASLVARYLVKLLAYHALTQPRVHGPLRRLYERTGRRHPLPRPTDASELRGDLPARYARRLSNAQAALGVRQLRRLDANAAHRCATTALIEQRLSGHGFRLPQPPAEADPVYVRYPVEVPDRVAAVAATAAHAVLGTWFTSVLEEAAAPTLVGYESGSCPHAELVARHLVNIPTHPRVRGSDVDAIVTALSVTAPSEATPDV